MCSLIQAFTYHLNSHSLVQHLMERFGVTGEQVHQRPQSWCWKFSWFSLHLDADAAHVYWSKVFILWLLYHPSGSTCKRIFVDAQYQEEILDGAEKLSRKVVLPELKARFFATLKHLFEQLRIVDPPQQQPLVQPRDLRVACYCQTAWDPPMIKCVGSQCTFTNLFSFEVMLQFIKVTVG